MWYHPSFAYHVKNPAIVIYDNPDEEGRRSSFLHEWALRWHVPLMKAIKQWHEFSDQSKIWSKDSYVLNGTSCSPHLLPLE